MIKRITAAALLLATQTAFASTFPEREIRLIVPFSAGGPTDVVARHLAGAMGDELGKTVVVENRPSAAGIVGIENLLRSSADGYTLMIHNIGMSTVKTLNPGLRFDPLTDFTYIGEVADVPMTLVGKTGLPAKDFDSLRAYLEKERDSINISNAGFGTASHLCALMLMSRLNVGLTMIPYKGAAPALTDLQGGQVDLMCDQITTTLTPIQSERVVAYGSTTQKRLEGIPDLPTLNEQGLDDFEISVWHAIYAPKGLDEQIVHRLSEALQAALLTDRFRDSMTQLGAMPVDVERATPQSLENHLRSQIDIWTPLIQQSAAHLQ